MKLFSRDNLPDPAEFEEFSKSGSTKMVRIEGPFTVVTREGTMECEDGWLAIDSRGWPYPIADDEQANIYQPAGDWNMPAAEGLFAKELSQIQDALGVLESEAGIEAYPGESIGEYVVRLLQEAYPPA